MILAPRPTWMFVRSPLERQTVLILLPLHLFLLWHRKHVQLVNSKEYFHLIVLVQNFDCCAYLVLDIADIKDKKVLFLTPVVNRFRKMNDHKLWTLLDNDHCWIVPNKLEMIDQVYHSIVDSDDFWLVCAVDRFTNGKRQAVTSKMFDLCTLCVFLQWCTFFAII